MKRRSEQLRIEREERWMREGRDEGRINISEKIQGVSKMSQLFFTNKVSY